MLSKEEILQKLSKGTIVCRLTQDLDDEYTPKKKGDLFIANSIDDANQLHGHWLTGGSMALIIGVDEFEIVGQSQ